MTLSKKKIELLRFQNDNMKCLLTFGAGHFLEADAITGLQYAIAFSGYGGIVNKNLLAVFRFDESEAFLFGKPFHRSGIRRLPGWNRHVVRTFLGLLVVHGNYGYTAGTDCKFM